MGIWVKAVATRVRGVLMGVCHESRHVMVYVLCSISLVSGGRMRWKVPGGCENARKVRVVISSALGVY